MKSLYFLTLAALTAIPAHACGQEALSTTTLREPTAEEMRIRIDDNREATNFPVMHLDLVIKVDRDSLEQFPFQTYPDKKGYRKDRWSLNLSPSFQFENGNSLSLQQYSLKPKQVYDPKGELGKEQGVKVEWKLPLTISGK